jgi:hypothetical protein
MATIIGRRYLQLEATQEELHNFSQSLKISATWGLHHKILAQPLEVVQRDLFQVSTTAKRRE